MQLTTRQRRFQKVRRVHCAVTLPCPDQRVHFVDEQDDATLCLLDFVQHSFQALFEFTAEFRPGNQRAHVQRKQAFALQAFRHIAIDDAQGKTFGDGRLADARLTDEDRIVLGPARKHLDRPADFLVAANHRIELAVAGILGQVARIFLEGFVAFFGIGGVGCTALAQLRDGVFQTLGRNAGILQNIRRWITRQAGKRQQEAFVGNKGVTGLLGTSFSVLEQFRAGLLQPQAGIRTGHFRQFSKGSVHALNNQFGPATAGTDEVHGHLVAILEHLFQNMGRRQNLMSCRQGCRLGSLNDGACALGVLLNIHVLSPFEGRSDRRYGHPAQQQCLSRYSSCGNIFRSYNSPATGKPRHRIRQEKARWPEAHRANGID